MTLEQALAERLTGWLAHSREHKQDHTCIPNIVVDDMLIILEGREKEHDRKLVERTIEVYQRGFERNAVVQDVIDEVRKLGEHT